MPTQWSDAFLAKVAGADKFNGLIDGSVKWDDPDVVKAFQTFSDVHFVSGDLFAVAKATKNPSAAKAFAEYLGSADAQAIWAKLGGFIAPNAKTDPSVYPTDNDRKAAKLFSQGTAVYDLDDAIGGQVQTVEREELKKLIQTHDVNAFIKAMVDASSGAGG